MTYARIAPSSAFGPFSPSKKPLGEKGLDEVQGADDLSEAVRNA